MNEIKSNNGKGAGRAYTEKNIRRVFSALTRQPQNAKDISHRINSNKKKGLGGRQFDSAATANVLKWMVTVNPDVIREFDGKRYYYRRTK